MKRYISMAGIWARDKLNEYDSRTDKARRMIELSDQNGKVWSLIDNAKSTNEPSNQTGKVRGLIDTFMC